jgi:methionine-rich copper-binding protein CopC
LPFSINEEVLVLLRVFRTSFVSIFLAALLLAAVAQPLWAHAVLMESSPKQNSSVKGPDVPIWLRFNARIDGGRSRLHLLAPDGWRHSLEGVKQPSPDTLTAQASGLKPVTYKMEWQVLASDGHISRGEVAFTVN